MSCQPLPAATASDSRSRTPLCCSTALRKASEAAAAASAQLPASSFASSSEGKAEKRTGDRHHGHLEDC